MAHRPRPPRLLRLVLAGLGLWEHPRPARAQWGGRSGPREQEFKLEIPRVTIEQLERNMTLRGGTHAFILVDWARRWNASKWTMDYLKRKIPFEWVDYYPENMLNPQNKPYLLKFDEAAVRYGQRSPQPKYMQLRLARRGWKRLQKDFQPIPLPEAVFWDDAEWIHKCMAKEDGREDKRAVDNFFVTNQWKFLLIGEKGTSMFFHMDGTSASSWQAQILGRKRWTLCPYTETNLLRGMEEMDTDKPDYKRFPNWAFVKCGRETVEAGEIVYYPGYWWHQALQMDTPTISYTGALVGVEAPRKDLPGQLAHTQFYNDLIGKCGKCWKAGKAERLCDDISTKWPGAAPPPLRVVCEKYLPACHKLWDEHAKMLHENTKQEL